MNESERAWRPRRRQGLRVAVLASVLLLAAAGTSRLGLGPARFPVAAFGNELAGARLRCKRIRLDLLFAGGIVLDRAELQAGPWRLDVPSLIVRPDLDALLHGRIAASLVARGFVLDVKAQSAPEALRAFGDWIAHASWPRAALWFSAGTVRLRGGERLLEHVELDLQGDEHTGRVVGHARQRGGGRVDLVGRPGGSGDGERLAVFLDAVRVADLRSWLGDLVGVPEHVLAEEPESVDVTGRWRVRREGAQGIEHRVELDLVSTGRAGLPTASPRVDLHASASVSFRGDARREARDALAGWIRVSGSLGRVRTVGWDDASRLLVSGPLEATVWLSGARSRPGILAWIDLGRAHLEAGRWLRKAAGVPAQIRLSRGLDTDRQALGVRVRLADVELALHRVDGAAIEGGTNWIPTDTLVGLCPALAARASGGRVRLIAVRLANGLRAARIALDGVTLRDERAPIAVRDVTGEADLRGRTLTTSGLHARLGATRFTLDLEAALAAEGELRVRFAARTDRLVIPKPTADAGPSAAPPAAGGLPAALRAAAAAPLELLRRERTRLSGIVIERGRLDANRVDAEGRIVRSLHLEIGLHDQILDVRRLAFGLGAARRAYRGTIDLSPLVPTVALASAP